MKGYLYLDNDGNLNLRNQKFIDEEDPGFWGRNAHLIDIVWKYDTENDFCMKGILSSLSKREIKTEKVLATCKAMGFDLQEFSKKHGSNKLGSGSSSSSGNGLA